MSANKVFIGSLIFMLGVFAPVMAVLTVLTVLAAQQRYCQPQPIESTGNKVVYPTVKLEDDEYYQQRVAEESYRMESNPLQDYQIGVHGMHIIVYDRGRMVGVFKMDETCHLNQIISRDAE